MNRIRISWVEKFPKINYRPRTIIRLSRVGDYLVEYGVWMLFMDLFSTQDANSAQDGC